MMFMYFQKYKTNCKNNHNLCLNCLQIVLWTPLRCPLLVKWEYWWSCNWIGLGKNKPPTLMQTSLTLSRFSRFSQLQPFNLLRATVLEYCYSLVDQIMLIILQKKLAFFQACSLVHFWLICWTPAANFAENTSCIEYFLKLSNCSHWFCWK